MKNAITLLAILFSGNMLFSQSDNCATATPIALSGVTCVNGTTVNNTPDNITTSCNTDPNVSFVWYQYTTTGSQNTITLNPGTLEDAVMVVDGTACGDATIDFCNNATGTNSITILDAVPIGTTILISVASTSFIDGDFELCIDSYTPTSFADGDECGNAIPYCDETETLSLTDMSIYTGSGSKPSCFIGAGSNPSQDVWITFTITQDGTIEWLGDPLTGTAEFDWAIYNTTGGCNGTMEACNYDWSSQSGADFGMGSTATEFEPAINATAGETYTIRVSNWAGNGAGFDFSWEGSALIAPVVDFTISPNSVTCGPSVDVTITDNSAGTPDWTFGNGDTYTGSTPPVQTYTTPGTYAITAVIGGACPAAATQYVELYGPLMGSVIGADALCPASCDGTASISSVSGGDGIYTYSWAGPSQNGATNPSLTGLCDGDYVVTIDNAICGTSIDLPVSIGVTNTQDDATYTLTPTCDGGTASISGTTGGVFTFNTAPTDAAVIDASTGEITGGTNGAVYDVLYTTSGACPDVLNLQVTAIAIDDPTFTIAPTCEGGISTISGTTGGQFTFGTAPTDGAVIDASTGVVSGGTSGSTYDVVYTTLGSCPASLQLPVTANLMDDASFTMTATCDGGTANLTGTPGGSYSFGTVPTDGAIINGTTGEITGGTPGANYDVNYATTGACASNSNMSVVALPLDDATFTLTATCDGGTASISGTAGGTFTFNTAPTDAAVIDASTGTVTGGAPGTLYDILYTTSGVCPASLALQVTSLVADDATFTLTPTCDGGTASISGTTGGTFTFNTVPTDAAIIDGSAGTVTNGSSGTLYDVLYTTAGACPTSLSLQVTSLVTDNATFTLTPTCDGGTASISGTTGGTFTFNTAPTDAAVIDASTGTISGGSSSTLYDVLYTTSGVCPSSLSLQVTSLVTDDATFTLTPTCDGGTAIISGTNGGTFTFNTAPSDAAVIDASTGTISGGSPGTLYDVLYTTSGVCPASLAIQVTSLIADDATFSLTPTCDGGTATISGTTGGTFTFNTAPTDAAVIDASTGTVTGGTSGMLYDILYTTSGACPSSSNIQVTALTTDDATFTLLATCDGGIATISGTTGGTFSFNIAPSDGAVIDGTTGVVSGGTPNTIYSVLYMTSGPCPSSSVVDVLSTTSDDPSFILSPNCDGVTALVTGTLGGVFSFNTPPSDGATIDAVSGTVTGGVGGTVYDILYATTGVCAASSTQSIASNSTPIAPTAGTDTEYCSTEDLLNMTASGNGGTLTWYSDAGLNTVITTGSTLTPNETLGSTVYYVTESLNGCEGPASEVVITVNLCDITLPTAFTPDGDGMNDDWEILDLDMAYPNNIVFVYNRWGNLLFTSDQGDYDNNRWDGTYKGSDLPVGSYYFIIEFNNEEQEKATGVVSIILNK